MAGWWYTKPSEIYYIVNYDDDIPNRWKHKIHVPNHQPDGFQALHVLGGPANALIIDHPILEGN